MSSLLTKTATEFARKLAVQLYKASAQLNIVMTRTDKRLAWRNISHYFRVNDQQTPKQKPVVQCQ